MSEPSSNGTKTVTVKMADGTETYHEYSCPDELADIMELQRRQTKASRVAKRRAQRKTTMTLRAYTKSLSGD